MLWIIDHIGWMAEEHWPLCVAAMAAMLLLGAYVEGGDGGGPVSGACGGPATLYLTAGQAAAYAGIGINAMRAYMDGATPPPMLVVGTRRYVQRDGLARYLEDLQTWHYDKERS